MDVKSFQSLAMHGERDCVYDTCNGVDRLPAVGSLVKRWVHWSGHVAVLRHIVLTYVDMPFIQCPKEGPYALQLALLVYESSNWADIVLVIHSLEYVQFPRRHDTVKLLTIFDYWWKKILSGRRLT